MSETTQEKGPAVNDRRRVDPDGNARNTTETHQAASGAGEAAGSAAPTDDPELQQLRQELETSRKRVDELARGYQALQTDREEFKARLNRERERLIDVERGKVALAIVEAIDELDLCLSASAQDTSPLAQGVRLIREKLISQLAAAGIQRLKMVGKPYNPELAEAADMEVTANPAEDQHVVTEVRAGYTLKDRILRPALVRVAKYVQPAQA